MRNIIKNIQILLLEDLECFCLRDLIIFKRSKAEKNKEEIDLHCHCRMHNLSKEGWQRVVTANLSVKKKFF